MDASPETSENHGKQNGKIMTVIRISNTHGPFAKTLITIPLTSQSCVDFIIISRHNTYLNFPPPPAPAEFTACLDGLSRLHFSFSNFLFIFLQPYTAVASLIKKNRNVCRVRRRGRFGSTNVLPEMKERQFYSPCTVLFLIKIQSIKYKEEFSIIFVAELHDSVVGRW